MQATCKALSVENQFGELEGVAVNRDTPPALSAHSFPRRVLPFYVPGFRTTTQRECHAPSRSSARRGGEMLPYRASCGGPGDRRSHLTVHCPWQPHGISRGIIIWSLTEYMPGG